MFHLFLLPFGSFLGVLGLFNLGERYCRHFLLPFGSFLDGGAGNDMPQVRYQLSTPFWEFRRDLFEEALKIKRETFYSLLGVSEILMQTDSQLNCETATFYSLLGVSS